MLVDHECGAVRVALGIIVNAVFLNHSAFEIAEYGKSQAEFFCPVSVCRCAVNADSEDLGVGAFEFRNISLILSQLFLSPTSESKHIKSQHHIFLALEVTQPHLVVIVVHQGEIGSRIAHLQLRFGHDRRLRGYYCRASQQCSKTECIFKQEPYF